MKLLIDENIPGAATVFGCLGEVRTLPGRTITRAVLHDIDALLVRSVTRVDRVLLAGTPVRFVASATAGIDHVDTPALAELGIAFAHAPGSNADSVVDYVLAVLALAFPGPASLRGRSVGIVGCGQVGGRLLRRLRALGVRCLVHDPLLGD
ncbi:MAG TPA: NAD(P)-dependent oxidoreductase, partial [Pseudomonadales bacterium]|nr:NAD(P)-dependent oxidoreductase [Pseudomonadales bacterium]